MSDLIEGAATSEEWTDAYLGIQERVQSDPQFVRLVKACAGYPNDMDRARRLATAICERLELDPVIYRGNVYGAAIERIEGRFG